MLSLNKIRNYIPGIILSVLIMLISQLLSRIIPVIGSATIAILSGILLGNIFFHSNIWSKGTGFCEKILLEISVVLLGFSITIQSIITFGLSGIFFILTLIIGTITISMWLGRKLGFSKKSTVMMAVGNAICGSSAIASIAPIIDADNGEKGRIITLVNLLGTILMLGMPVLVVLLFKNNPLKQGAVIGGTIQSVGQVAGAGSILGVKILNIAMLFKIIRIMFLAFVVIFFSYFGTSSSTNEKKIVWQKIIPWYVIGFLLIGIINSYFPISKQIILNAHNFGTYLEITALAAIGLRLDISAFFKEGKKLALYGLGVGFSQIVLSFIFIKLFY